MTSEQRALIGAQAALTQLSGWSAAPGRDALTRTFRFADFSAAFAFMTRVALAAEALDHHPEWTNVYDRVAIILSTHSAGGVTGLDLKLAGLIDGFAAGAGAS